MIGKKDICCSQKCKDENSYTSIYISGYRPILYMSLPGKNNRIAILTTTEDTYDES